MVVEHEYLINSDWKNSIDYKPLIYDLAEDLMYFCILYPVFILINRYFDVGVGLYFRVFILFISMIAMTINRRKTKRIYAFALILFAIVALVALIPMNLPIKVEMLCAVLISAIVSVKKLINAIRRVECRNDPSIQVSNNIFLNISTIIFGICFLYLTYMVSLALNVNGMIYICLIVLALLLSCFVIYTHKVGTHRLIESNKSQTSSTGKIKRFNLFFTCCTATLVVIIGFLTYVIVYFTGLSRIDDIIIGLFTHTQKETKFKEILNTEIPNTEISNKIDILKIFGKGNQQPNLLMQILGKGLMVIFGIAIAALILIALFMLFRSFLKRFRYNINEETKSVFPIHEVTNEVFQKIKKSRIIALFSGYSNSVKIRKLYYKLIKKYWAKGVPIENTDTPTEIELKIEKDASSNINAATLIYQKARYGFKDCEKNDVELIKSRLKR